MMSTFPPHAGGMQHPGMAHGPQMGPGQMPHPGQPMGQPMQMHAGVSGPAGPHVSQGPMMGMQPGMAVPGANAHAMSHLAPNAQMIQQQTMANNPMMQQYQRQQQLMFQRAQMQQMQAQGNVPMGFQNAMNAGLNPQQMAAMQAGNAHIGGVNLPQHMQMQQTMAHNQLRMQAAQQAAHQQQQQQQQQNLAGQQPHLAMQQVTSQGSNQGQPTPQPHPGVPQAGPPNRPSTSMGGPQSAQPSPAQPPERSGPPQGPQQSQPPQQPSTSAPQMQPSQTQSGPPQTQQQNQQGPQHPQQGPQQGQQGQVQQGHQQAQSQAPQNQQIQAQQQAQALKNQQAAAQQNAAARYMQAQRPAQGAISGAMMLNVIRFADKLGSFRLSDGQSHNDIIYWRNFINQHFTEDGTLRLILRPMTQNEKGVAKTFEVGAPSLPRYFWTQYDSQVDQIQFQLDGLEEKKLDGGYFMVKASRSKMIYWFKDSTQLVWTGELTALYLGDKMENLTFETKEHQQYIPRSKLEELCAQASPDQNRSPRMTKKTNPRNQQRQQAAQPSFDRRMLPSSPVTDMGTTPRIQNFLEVGETFSFMKELMYFAQENPKLSVSDAMKTLVQTYKANQQKFPVQMNAMQQQFMQQQQQGQGQMGMPPGAQTNPAMHQMQQQGARTPNAPGMQGQFMSPAMQNSLLPGANQANGSPHMGGQNPMMNAALQGSTHTPSPAQSHMAPPMVPQQSQQGSTSGASANTSPNTGNKRRRSTQVGVKDEDGGGQPNGAQQGATKVKASPRMSSNTAKRMKGN